MKPTTEPERIVTITLDGRLHWSGEWWKAWKVMLTLIKDGATRIEVFSSLPLPFIVSDELADAIVEDS